MDKKDITVDIEANAVRSPKRPIINISPRQLERYPASPSYTEKNERWEICCSGSSSHFVKYAAQISVYFAILIFALVNIGLGKNDPIYWSLLTLIIGAIAPAPTLKREKI